MKYVLIVVLALLGFLPLEARTTKSSATRATRSSVSRQQSVHHRSSGRSYARHRSYYNSYGGYYGGYGTSYRLRSLGSGIRFSMDLVSKEERKMVERGIVMVDGAEQGIVDRFDSWQNGHVPVASGQHEVSVQLEDGRIFQTSVFAQPGQVVRVYVRFTPVGK